ncbi:PAS domain S-box protein [bacterium]|nr:PAS domain S-box protein [bacterium]
MSQPKIMIVEDELIIAHDIKRILINSGYVVSAIASSGELALQQIDKLKPDLVLMDIKLKGDMNGIETAGQAHALYDVPVVYMTANADIETVERAKQAEPYGFIYKPVQPVVLKAVIEMALYKHGAEKQLKQREAWLDATLNSIGDAVISTDIEGLIISMNPVAEKLTGWKQDMSVGRPLTKVFKIKNIKTGKRIVNPLIKVLKDGITVGLANHTVLITKDGREIQIADSAAPIRDTNGEVSGVVLVFRDVTEEYQMRETVKVSEHKFRTVLENSLDTVYHLNLITGTYDYLSPSAIDVYGYTPEEMITRGLKGTASSLHPDDKAELQNHLDKLFSKSVESEISPTIEYRFKHKTLGYRWISDTRKVMYDQKGIPIAIIGTARDITDRIQTEEALKESEQRYKNFITHSSEGIYCIDIIPPLSIDQSEKKLVTSINKSAVIVEVNHALAHMYGIEPEEMIGRRATDFAPQYGERVILILQDEKYQVVNIETLDADKDGNPVYLMESFHGEVRDKKLHRIWGVQRNNIERKRSEIELKESEQRYRHFISHVSDGVYRLECDNPMALQMSIVKQIDYLYDHFIVAECNDQFIEMYGFENREQVVGMNMASFYGDKDNPANLEIFRKFIKSGYRLENELTEEIDSQGNVKYILNNSFGIIENSSLKQIWGTQVDVTLQKQAEERFQLLMQQIPYVVEIYDVDGLQINVNSAYEKLWGFPAQTTVNKFNVLKSKEVEDTGLMTYVKRAYSGEVVTVPEFEFNPTGATETKSKGRIRWLSTRIFPLKSASGEVLNIVITREDITQRKLWEKTLKDSEEKFSKAFYEHPTAMVIFHVETKVRLDVNKSFEALTEYSRSEILNENIYEKSLGIDSEVRRAAVTRLIKDGSILNFPIELLTKSGEIKNLLMSAVIPEIADNKIAIVSLVDITDIRKTEEKMNQALYEKKKRIKEIRSLYGITESIYTRHTLEQIFEDTVRLIPTGWQYPEITAARVCYGNEKYVSRPFTDTEWKQKADILLYGQYAGFIEVFYLEERPDMDEGPFLSEERELIDNIARSLSEAIEHHKTEDELHSSEAQYSNILHTTQEGFWLIDKKGRILDVNSAYAAMSGYTVDELLGKAIVQLEVVENAEEVQVHIEEIINKGSDLFESQHRRKDGSIFDVEVSASYFPHGDIVFIVFIRDITDRKKVEKTLQENLQEKHVMIQEIHHRVKNNLQVMRSLINLQKMHTDNEQFHKQADDLSGRILSMALVHSQLYKSDNLAFISLHDYIHELVKNLTISYGRSDIFILNEAEVLNVSIDRAVPIGLILNELVSNAVKHAFPDKGGNIKIISQVKGEKLVLIVEDDGIGCPALPALENADTLGFELIHILTMQLEGEITIDGSNGLKVKIAFPNPR